MNKKLGLVRKIVGIALCTMACVCLIACNNSNEHNNDNDDKSNMNVFETIEFVDGLAANTAYEFKLEYDDEKNVLSGSMKATIKNCSGYSWDELVFEDWTSNYYTKVDDTKITNCHVTIDGKTKKVKAVRGEDVSSVHFKLPKEVASEDIVIFECDVKVKVPMQPDRFGYIKNQNDRCIMLGNALPVLALFKDGEWRTHIYVSAGESFNSESAYYDVTLTCPDNLNVLMTGIPDKKENKGSVTYHSIEGNIRDFTIVLTEGYNSYDMTHEGVLITVMGGTASDDELKEIAEYTCDILDYFGEMVGPYPYASIDVCLADVEGFGGMEYPELVILETNMALDNAGVLAHELGHEWFYLVVGNDEFVDPWIDEGITSYISNLYCDANDIAILNGYVDEYILSWYDGLHVNCDASDLYYGIAAYMYAPTFLREIHGIMGDEAFYNALKEIYNTYKYKQAETKDVLTIFNNNSEVDLTDIFGKYFIF